MRVGILLFEKWHGREEIGSSRLRGHWYVKNWPDAELFRQGAQYDVIIFQKTYWLEYIKAFKGIKILDLCDPDWLDTQPIVEILDNVDAITVSSEGLKTAIEQFTDKPVVFIPDRQDMDFHKMKKEKHEEIAKWVVWYGYSGNSKLLDKTILTLKKLKLKLKVISDCVPPYGKADKNVKYDWKNPAWSFDREVTECDIVLLPQDSRPRGKYKSTNKTLTAWTLGMPVAKTPEELQRFLDPIERQKEADLRYQEVKDKWDIKQSVEEFKNLINQLKNERTSK